jgi:hypothetical protein
MLIREARTRPKPWAEHRASRRPGTIPFHAIEWGFQWCAFTLSRWAFLEVLEYAGSLSVLVAIVFYFAEAGDRKKQKHYQAWQVINTAQGKGGSGGRIEAMQELNNDHEPLVGIDASGAFLRGIKLRRADLLRCDLNGSDLRMSDFSNANMESSNLRSANFRSSNLRDANLKEASLDEADLVGASLQNADLSGATLNEVDLRQADLSGVKWQKIAAIEKANIRDVRNAPAGFVTWAIAHGAVTQ